MDFIIAILFYTLPLGLLVGFVVGTLYDKNESFRNFIHKIL